MAILGEASWHVQITATIDIRWNRKFGTRDICSIRQTVLTVVQRLTIEPSMLSHYQMLLYINMPQR
jgi:hypothetical protein